MKHEQEQAFSSTSTITVTRTHISETVRCLVMFGMGLEVVTIFGISVLDHLYWKSSMQTQ